MRIWCAGLLLAAFGVGPAARGADFPEFSPGRTDLTFAGASPLSTDAELKRRFDAPRTPPAYDVAKESFRVDVPGSYRHDAAGWGLFVWVDSSPRPELPPDWGPVLAARKLIVVAAHDSGNARELFDRCRMAVDAVHNMRRRFHVDPARVYVSGSSGGGRVASMLGVAYADVFAGSFPMIGANFYKPIPAGKENQYWLPVYLPAPEILKRARAGNRFVLLTGETDFNRENTRRVYDDGFKAEGFRHVLYLEVPGSGHSRPPAEWLEKGIRFLDDGALPRDGR